MLLHRQKFNSSIWITSEFALDYRIHGIQEIGQIDDFGSWPHFPERMPFRPCRRQHQVNRRPDADHVEVDMGPG